MKIKHNWLKAIIYDQTTLVQVLITALLALPAVLLPWEYDEDALLFETLWSLIFGIMLMTLGVRLSQLGHILKKGLWIKARVVKELPLRRGLKITWHIGNNEYKRILLTQRLASGRKLLPSQTVWLRCDPVSRVCHPVGIYADEYSVPVDTSQRFPAHETAHVSRWEMFLHDPMMQISILLPICATIVYSFGKRHYWEINEFWEITTHAIGINFLNFPANCYRTRRTLAEHGIWVQGTLEQQNPWLPTLVYRVPIDNQTIEVRRRIFRPGLVRQVRRGEIIIIAVNPIHPEKGKVISPFVNRVDVDVRMEPDNIT